MSEIEKKDQKQSIPRKIWTCFKKYENIRIFLSVGIVVLFILFILAMFFCSVACILKSLTGIKEKSELLQFIGWGMGGFIATLGVVGLLQRAAALDEQNKIAEKDREQRKIISDEQNRITKEGQEKEHIHERFKAATEHLGSEHISVRIAAFNEFYRLAEIEPDLRKTIFDILCAHLRQTTKDKNYQPVQREVDMGSGIETTPTEEAQSLLNILFKPKNKNDFIFYGINADLAGVNLQGSNLHNANLQKADLQGANLKEADLREANLQEAYLYETSMQQANLQKANLQKANLREASMQSARLQKANLQEADLFSAELNGANLSEVDLRKAVMYITDLINVNLHRANLQRAVLSHAYLNSANLQEAKLQDASLYEVQMNKNTKMPDNWKSIIEKNESSDIYIRIVDDNGNVIESY